MPFKTVKEFLALTGKDAPTEGERALIAHCQAGDDLILALTAPTSATKANTIRASLLRLLITGATPECGLHALGVAVRGAWIEGKLDLDYCTARGQTVMEACHFTKRPCFAYAKLTLLSLDGSHLPGLYAQGMETQGSVYLRNLTAKFTVDVKSAKIGGQLVCDGAALNGAGGKALNAQSMEAKGTVFLRHLNATGTVHLLGAKIGGQLECEGATLNGAGGFALNAQRMVVAEGFLFRKLSAVTGCIYLSAAHVSDLVDDAESWPEAPDDLILDGFTYDRITGGAPITLAARRKWLAAGSSVNNDFRPQPYTHLARILRGMGQFREADKVLGEMPRQRDRVFRQKRLSQATSRTKQWLATVLNFFHWLLTSTIRLFFDFYSKPIRSAIACASFLVFAAAVLAQTTWTEGSFAPNSAVILTSQDWQDISAKGCITAPIAGCDPNPADTWSAKNAKGMDWDSFSSIAYATDLVLPLVDLGQTSAWAPSKDRGVFGCALWWGRWVFILAGWIVASLGLAAVTGFVQKNAPE